MKVPENNDNEERFEHFNKTEHEHAEHGQTEEGEEEYNAAGPQQKFSFKDFSVEDIADKVLIYIKSNNANVDKESLLKYAAVAVLGLYGLRKSGFMGNILISAAVALIAKHFLLADYEKEGAKRDAKATL